MTVKELRDRLESLPDDFEVVVCAEQAIDCPGSLYDRFPNYDTYAIEFGDTGYSDKVTRLDINLDNPL